MWEWRKGGRRRRGTVVISSGVVAEDQRGEEVADAREVAWDEWYTSSINCGYGRPTAWRAATAGHAD
jgi:hypothetical protein